MTGTEHSIGAGGGIDRNWSTDQLRQYVAGLPIWLGKPVLEPMIGGLCNTSFKVTDGKGSYVARIGFDIEVHGIYQYSVQATAAAASRLSVTPKVVHVEPSLIVAEFATGGALKPEDVRDYETLKKIVGVIRTLHTNAAALNPATTYFWPFQVVRRYAEIGLQRGSRLSAKIPDLVRICNRLERHVDPFMPVFTHNDVVPQNMVFGGDRSVLMIDWDYGGFGHANFDVAGIVINADAPDDLDDEVIRLYHGECTAALRKQYHLFKIMVTLREYLWGMAQEVTSQLSDELVGAAMSTLYADQKAGYEGYTDLNEARFNRLWSAAAAQFG